MQDQRKLYYVFVSATTLM